MDAEVSTHIECVSSCGVRTFIVTCESEPSLFFTVTVRE